MSEIGGWVRDMSPLVSADPPPLLKIKNVTARTNIPNENSVGLISFFIFVLHFFMCSPLLTE